MTPPRESRKTPPEGGRKAMWGERLNVDKAAVQIVGGEQYILSAVMHADEINRAMTEALGREVYHLS